jgi:hypothetical protein
MPMLLEDLAEETSASNRRVADRLDAEARNLDELRGTVAAWEELRPNVIELARLATDYAVSRAPLYEGFMRSAVAAVLKEPTGDADGLLGALLKSFKSGQRLVRAVRSLWETADQMGGAPERFDELDQGERRLEELTAEAERALEHRARDWQPADPDRLAQGLQLARAGKTVKAAEARAWFRRTPE